ncbi:hypothetical protein STSP2_00117 [Anaerohalosphaera lusitana]|uniref:Uncharacterized protein n=1 Tax=Anaerohalosphaera lusitana TaxID=1936003 RepID=A0A1U9NGC2_9BACT|nr:hypothetical protein [Anaerohalosphaera lusitana]AQT66979.1 hypothetical protein STSP2_00117 [Anaerohalosphaera lusitana]
MRTGLIILMLVMLAGASAWATNIDPYDEEEQYVWSENVGWIDAKANGDGMEVTSGKVMGYLWSSSVGWINLYPRSSDPAVGVKNDGQGNLSGLAWGENVGWINFDPKVPNSKVDYGVKIDADGYFSGWAWGENIGWINFNSASLAPYGARVCIVKLEDLERFASQWLRSGYIYAADLNRDYQVDFADFALFAKLWLDYCPCDWGLK